MLDAVAHRGPDGKGMLKEEGRALAHARLAIVDLEGGAQPMSDRETGAHIVYNGEVYNHMRLRKGMGARTFQTRSDTETVLRLACSGRPTGEWLREMEGMFAFAVVRPAGYLLARDSLGIKPLYVSRRGDQLAFCSEIRPLLGFASSVEEFPPGHYYDSAVGLRAYRGLNPEPAVVAHAETARRGLLRRLTRSVRASLTADVPVGVFLSGGLDSSLIAALAAKFCTRMSTFAVGTADSEDLVRARTVATCLGTRHHERIFTVREAVDALPEVIRHLESFDCALVRSAVPNYLLAEFVSHHVKVALSGEGADELFAGYDYLKKLPLERVGAELLDITRGLHNTNLQRCDRMSMAHGLEVRVPFLDDPDLVDYAFKLPMDLKQRGAQRVDKWILRRAAKALIPPEIALRRKEKFGSGSGLSRHLTEYATYVCSDADFRKEREIADGVFLRSKEELLYYRIFRRYFKPDQVLPLMGRSHSV